MRWVEPTVSGQPGEAQTRARAASTLRPSFRRPHVRPGRRAHRPVWRASPRMTGCSTCAAGRHGARGRRAVGQATFAGMGADVRELTSGVLHPQSSRP